VTSFRANVDITSHAFRTSDPLTGNWLVRVRMPVSLDIMAGHIMKMAKMIVNDKSLP